MDCIVNVTQNWGIGKDGDLLVSIPTDLRRFRALTTGKTVIYGRKTLLTFPHARPLPNRENWILSATPGFSVPGAAVFPSLAALQEALRTRPADSLCLIGGASVYRALLPWCSRVLLTQTCLPTVFSPIWTGSRTGAARTPAPCRRTAAIASAI